MKRTTYIMIGAFISGFVVIGVMMLIYFSNPVPTKDLDETLVISEEIDIKTIDEPITGQFSHIVYKDATKGRQRITFGYITVTMSDTVNVPTLHTAWSSERIVDMEVKNDTLFLSADFAAINDSINKLSRFKRLIATVSGESLPLNVILPQGASLHSVANRSTSVMLEDVRFPGLNVRTNSHLMVRDCDIDTLRCFGRNLSRLEVAKSVVGLFTMSMPNQGVDIDCCDNTGYIKTMEISGNKKSNRYNELDMTKANVGSVKWLPDGPKAQLNIIVNRPTEFTQINP